MDQPGANRIMVIGSSTAQEALLYEEFERAFPQYDTYQMAFGAATLDEVLVALDYIERVYGTGALPAVLIVGLEARSLANLPRRFGSRREVGEEYLYPAIDEYSPFYKVRRTEEAGSVLEPKTGLEAWSARWRFWSKQQEPRYRYAVVALLNRMVSGPGPNLEWTSGLPTIDDIRNPLAPASIRVFTGYVAADPIAAFRGWLAAYIAPYHHFRPRVGYHVGPGGPNGVHFWDPRTEAELLVGQVQRLRETAASRGMRLFVVNLPEHPESRESQPPEYYESLISLTLEALADTPFIDLRSFGDRSDFLDDAHLTRPAAERVTAAVIRFIQARGGLG
jgi:hypothetical protein